MFGSRKSAAAGAMLIVTGVWVITQVWWGGALERLGI
jgi:hypothetical protein